MASPDQPERTTGSEMVWTCPACGIVVPDSTKGGHTTRECLGRQGVAAASPDHAATVREAIMGGHLPPDPATWLDYRLNACDALDALVAALAQARQERDELSWKLNKDSQWFELLATRERAERAERERDRAIEALREEARHQGLLAARTVFHDPLDIEGQRIFEHAAGVLRDVLANIEKNA